MSFPCEMDAFRKLQRVLGASTVQLLDTYDTLEGARRAAKLGGPMWGVRLDSGDFDELSRQVRDILDEAGLPRRQNHGRAAIWTSTAYATWSPPARPSIPSASARNSPPAPTRPTWAPSIKWWSSKSAASSASPPSTARTRSSLPGAKQVFRDVMRDVIARSGECGKGEALLRPMHSRRPPDRAAARRSRRLATRAAQSIANLPPALRQLEVAEPWPVIHSRELRELIGQTRSNLRG